MNKILISESILLDALTNALLALEKGQYQKSEKLLNYVKGYAEDLDTFDEQRLAYAFIIIYANTDRFEEAYRLCVEFLRRKDAIPEMVENIEGIKNRLESYFHEENAYGDEEKGFSDSLVDLDSAIAKSFSEKFQMNLESDHQGYYSDTEMMQIVTEQILLLNLTKKQQENLLGFFEFDKQVQSYFDQVFNRKLEMTTENVLLTMFFHESIIKAQRVGIYYYDFLDYYRETEGSKLDLQKIDDVIDMFPALTAYNIIFYLQLIKDKIVNDILIVPELAFTINSPLLFTMSKLYELKIIGNLKVKYYNLIQEKIIETKISELTADYYQEVINEYRKIAHVYTTDKVVLKILDSLLQQVRIRTMPYPVFMFFQEKNPMEKTMTAMLYAISDYIEPKTSKMIEEKLKYKRETMEQEIAVFKADIEK